MVEQPLKPRRGGNLRNGRTTHPAKARRQETAKQRQGKYTALSTQQKIQLHLSRVGMDEGGNPKGGLREWKRLTDKLATENLAVVQKAQKKAEKADRRANVV